MKKVLLVLVFLAALVSCKTTDAALPENSGVVIETQSAVAADTAVIVSGAKSADDEARTISSALGIAVATAKSPELAQIADLAVKHTATTATLVKTSTRLEKDVVAARLQVVQAVKNQAIAETSFHTEHVARIAAEGQRNIFAAIATSGFIIFIGCIVLWIAKCMGLKLPT